MNSWAYLIGLLVLLGSCTIKKLTVTEHSSLPKNSEELIKRVNSKKSEAQWISLKGKLSVTQKDREFNLSINIKNKKDSIIWISARGPFSVEIVRMQMTPDSIYFMNRTNKTYLIKSVSQIKGVINLTFYDLQDMITANLKILKKKYQLESDKNEFYLLQDDNLIYSITRDYKVQKAKIFDNKNTIQITFDNYNNKDHFPRKLSINSDAGEFSKAIINYSKVELNKSQKILFEIPESYNETK